MKIKNLVLPWTPQRIKNAKNVAVYFKDVKTEETFSSQDQKLVEKTKIKNLVLPWTPQRIKNPKNVAEYFKDVKTEETFSSQASGS